MNKVKIEHNGNHATVFLNDIPLKGVIDFKIRKNSAQKSTEFIVVLDAVELTEYIKE